MSELHQCSIQYIKVSPNIYIFLNFKPIKIVEYCHKKGLKIAKIYLEGFFSDMKKGKSLTEKNEKKGFFGQNKFPILCVCF